MLRRDVLKGMAAAAAATAVGTRRAAAQDVIKIGACLSLIGGFQTVGRQALAGAKLYMQLNGDRVAGKKIELIVRDDTGVPDVARRIVQEMIVNEKVNIVLGGITPTALCARPARDAGEDPDRGDHLGRVDHDRPLALHDAHQLHARPVVDDHGRMGGEERQQEGRLAGQRLGARRRSRDRVRQRLHGRRRAGDREAARCRSPTRTSRRSCSASATSRPDTAFIYFPGQQGGTFARQFVERGLDKANIKIIGPGDLTDDDELPGQGDVMLGVITAHHYSAAHHVADEQEIRRGVQEGEQLPPELHLDRRLGRHAPDLRGAEEDQRLRPTATR